MLPKLERRQGASVVMMLASPLIAIGLTLIIGAGLFAMLGKDPLLGLFHFFVDPLLEAWSLEEVFVKATPHDLIGNGLCICFLSKTWNNSEERQMNAGALAGSG